MTDAEVNQAERECNMADPQYRAGYEDGCKAEPRWHGRLDPALFEDAADKYRAEGAAAERERIKQLAEALSDDADMRTDWPAGYREGLYHLCQQIDAPSGEE